MKVQKQEVVFSFLTASKYDEIALRKGLRTMYGLMGAVRDEFKRIELVQGKSAEDFKDDDMHDFSIELNLAETFAMFQSTLGLTEKEADALLSLELKEKTAMQLASEILVTFMGSSLFQASLIKGADVNPKSPKQA